MTAGVAKVAVSERSESSASVAVGFALFLFVLAPYLNAGGRVVNGALFGIALLLLVAPWTFGASLRQAHVYLFGAWYVAVGLWGAFVAELYGVTNITVIKLFLSVALYIVFGYAVGVYLARRGDSFEAALTGVLRAALAIIVINSVVVIAEFFIPPLRSVVEAMLADTGGNIDYKTHPFRLRGLASAGGAGLSVLHGLGCSIALTLLKARKIRPMHFALSMALCAFSCLFIGRTGFVVIALAVLLFAAANLSAKGLRLLVTSIAGLAVIVWVAVRVIAEFVPEEIQEYSILFFFGGFQGLQREGTIEIVRRFLFVPDDARHLLFGIGYFGGESILARPTDSGYMRTMLSFGLPLAVAVYVSVVVYLMPVLRPVWARAHVLPLLILLLLVEVKEPLIYQAYSARVLFLLGGIGFAYQNRLGSGRGTV